MNAMTADATTALDERTLAYIGRAQDCFTFAQDAASRVAGLLVLLEVTGGSRLTLDHGARANAKELMEHAEAQFGSLRPTEQSGHFHHHLGQGLRLVRQTLDEIDRKLDGLIAARDPLPILQQAWAELRSASRLLPGFEVVDFTQSCCALHVGKAKV